MGGAPYLQRFSVNDFDTLEALKKSSLREDGSLDWTFLEYLPIVETIGDILLEVEDGLYEGDSLFLLRKTLAKQES